MNTLSAKTKVLIFFLFCVLGIMGFSYINQLIYGLGVTGMNRPVFWGLYIVNFVFLIGASAGGIAVAALSNVAGIEKFKPIGRIAEIVATISLMLAMLSIFIDLGRPTRLLNLFIFARPISPLIWDIAIVNIYMLFCIILLWSSLANKPKLAKIFSYISLPAFILVHTITAWIFGLMKSQSGWHTTILAPLFICSALVSGLALVILGVIFVRWAFDLKIKDDVVIGLGKYFKILLPILFYFLICEFITVGYAGIPSDSLILNELLSGKFSSIFWFDMLLGIIIPFLLVISKHGETVGGVTLISVFSFLGVFAERTNIILPSFYHTLLGNLSVSYSPTFIELSIIAGIYALGILLFTVAVKIIPLREV